MTPAITLKVMLPVEREEYIAMGTPYTLLERREPSSRGTSAKQAPQAEPHANVNLIDI